jgi:hypothetical protein
MSGSLAAVGPGTHDVDWRFPAAIHDCTYGYGSNLLVTETPLSLMNMALETVLTFIRVLLSHTVSFIAENPLSHSAVLPGNVSAAARSFRSSDWGFPL